MIKKTIKFNDYNGNALSEDFYFHISKAEWVRFLAQYPGGIDQWVESVQQSHNISEVYGKFEELVQMAYGVKSADGRQFMKSPEITKQFTETEAYSELIMEFLSDTEKAIEFFAALFDVDANEVKKQVESQGISVVK